MQKSLLAGVRPRREEAGKMPALLFLHQSEMRSTPWRALRRITLPLIAANLIAGGLLAFSFAMLEVSDSLILAQRQQDFPITKAIYELYQLPGEGKFLASALGVWAMVFLATAIGGACLLLGKKLGATFRV